MQSQAGCCVQPVFSKHVIKSDKKRRPAAVFRARLSARRLQSVPTELRAVCLQNVKGVGLVSAVSVQGAGQSTWISAVNKWGGQWEVNNMPGSGPYNLYIVLADNTRVCAVSCVVQVLLPETRGSVGHSAQKHGRRAMTAPAGTCIVCCNARAHNEMRSA